jgi:predicted nucleic acid-binding protein
MSWVVDASIAVTWVIPERPSEYAVRLLADGEPLLAPDLLFVEAANALWKKAKRPEITRAEAGQAVDVRLGGVLDVRPTAPLVPRALELAGRLDHPVCDCVYVALAESERLPLVSADARLSARVRTRRPRVSVVDLATL